MQLGTCCSSRQFRKTRRLLTRRSNKPCREHRSMHFPPQINRYRNRTTGMVATDKPDKVQCSTLSAPEPLSGAAPIPFSTPRKLDALFLQHLSSLTPKDEAFENHKSRLILKMQPAEILGSRCIHIHDGNKETMYRIYANMRRLATYKCITRFLFFSSSQNSRVGHY